MISKTGIHTLLALAALADLPKGKFKGTGAIAKSIDAPKNYLGKLLQSLIRDGLVISQKGYRGGFCLAKPAAEISLLEALDPTEKMSRWEKCFLGHPFCCSSSACQVHRRWSKIREEFLNFLKTTNVSDIVENKDILGRDGT